MDGGVGAARLGRMPSDRPIFIDAFPVAATPHSEREKQSNPGRNAG